MDGDTEIPIEETMPRRGRAFLILSVLNYLTQECKISPEMKTPEIAQEMRNALEHNSELAEGHSIESLAWLKEIRSPRSLNRHISSTLNSLITPLDRVKARFHSVESRPRFLALQCCGSAILELEGYFSEAESIALRKTELTEEQVEERILGWINAGRHELNQLRAQQATEQQTQHGSQQTAGHSIEVHEEIVDVEGLLRAVPDSTGSDDVSSPLSPSPELANGKERVLLAPYVSSMQEPALGEEHRDEEPAPHGKATSSRRMATRQKRRLSSDAGCRATKKAPKAAPKNPTSRPVRKVATNSIDPRELVLARVDHWLAQSANEFNVHPETIQTTLTNIRTGAFDSFTGISWVMYPQLENVLESFGYQVINNLTPVAILLTGCNSEEQYSAQLWLALYGRHGRSPLSAAMFLQTVFMAYIAHRVFSQQQILEMLHVKSMSNMGSTVKSYHDWLRTQDPILVQITNKAWRSFCQENTRSEGFQTDVGALALTLVNCFLESFAELKSDNCGQLRPLRDELADLMAEAINLQCKLQLCSSRYKFEWPCIDALLDPRSMSEYGESSSRAMDTNLSRIRISSSPVVLCAYPGDANDLMAEAWEVSSFKKLGVVCQAHVESWETSDMAQF